MAVALLLSQLRYPRVDCPLAPAQQTSVTSQVFRAPMSTIGVRERAWAMFGPPSNRETTPDEWFGNRACRRAIRDYMYFMPKL